MPGMSRMIIIINIMLMVIHVNKLLIQKLHIFISLLVKFLTCHQNKLISVSRRDVQDDNSQ